MSQEVIIVRCFSCETFQTQIQKKAKKWECKMCGEKQSLKKTYGHGSGKACRQHTQYLNEMRGKLHETEEPVEVNLSSNINIPHCFNTIIECCPPAAAKASKWDQFLPSKLKVPDNNNDDDDDDDGGGGVQQQAMYKESAKLSSKMFQQKTFKTKKNKFSVFEASDIVHNNSKLSQRERQCTENYPTSSIIKKSAVDVNRYKPMEYDLNYYDIVHNSSKVSYKERQCTDNDPTSSVIKKSAVDVNRHKPIEFNLNLISNSSVNKETKSDKSKVESKRIEELDAFTNVNRETATLNYPTTGISVFDQDADFDLAMEF